MTRSKIRLNTGPYRRTHGQAPWQTVGKGLWAFCLVRRESGK